jgi:hypothetical protein
MPKDDKPEDNRVGFLQVGVDIYNGYKISKDGLSREEDVEVMKGFNDEDKTRNVGWKIWKKAFGGKEDNGDQPGD